MDHVVSLRIVLANSSLVCTNRGDDLFWAGLGGSPSSWGGCFGIHIWRAAIQWSTEFHLSTYDAFLLSVLNHSLSSFTPIPTSIKSIHSAPFLLLALSSCSFSSSYSSCSSFFSSYCFFSSSFSSFTPLLSQTLSLLPYHSSSSNTTYTTYHSSSSNLLLSLRHFFLSDSCKL
jgi:hypothetical protein